jgi:hypothetical protein
MNTRAVMTNGLSTLALCLTPIAGSSCAAPADPGGSADEGPLASYFQADTPADDPVVEVDPTDVRILNTCRRVATFVVDTGRVGFQPRPQLERGTCASDVFTIFDPFEPQLGDNDLFDIREAGEICGNIGASRTFLKFFFGPGVTPTSRFCADFPGFFFADRQPRRRWVSEFGCCAAGTVAPPQTVPLTRTERDCSGAVVGTPGVRTFGSATIGPNSVGRLVATVRLVGAEANTAYDVRLIQTPNGGPSSPQCSTINVRIRTSVFGNAQATISEPLLSTTTDAFVSLTEVGEPNDVITSAEVFF